EMKAPRRPGALAAAALAGLLAAGSAAGAGLRARECPLCAAEDDCHVACAEVKRESPGGRYCLEACNGAHPGDSFDAAFFAAADGKMKESAELDAHIKELGRELSVELGRL
ncbi:unnamed protein product, partial [Prorocentrum cordatum]